jgi:hypothetical protein
VVDLCVGRHVWICVWGDRCGFVGGEQVWICGCGDRFGFVGGATGVDLCVARQVWICVWLDTRGFVCGATCVDLSGNFLSWKPRIGQEVTLLFR